MVEWSSTYLCSECNEVRKVKNVLDDGIDPETGNPYQKMELECGHIQKRLRVSKEMKIETRAVILSPAGVDYQTITTQIENVLNTLNVTPISIHSPGYDRPTMAPAINRADFVIADVSGANPNVMYEVGYAQAKSKPIVFIARPDEKNRIPISLSGQFVHVYDPKDPSSLDTAISRSVKLIGKEMRNNE